MNNKQNNKITSRDVDFAKWYTDIVMAAKLSSYSNTKGCMVIEPNGYAIVCLKKQDIKMYICLY